jgi:hypothetical protein
VIPAKRCKHCGTLIRVVETAPGKWTPVDARPSRLNGQVVLLADAKAELLSNADARQRRDAGEDLHVVHWDTCPGSRAARADRAIEARRPRESPKAVKAARAALEAQSRRRVRARQERLFR